MIVGSQYEPRNMRNDHVVADCLDVADFIPDVSLRPLSLLEPDVNRMKVLVPLDERTKGASPHNVSCELTIQHVGISLIVSGMQTGREPRCRFLRLEVGNGKRGTAGCISVLLHKVSIPGDSGSTRTRGALPAHETGVPGAPGRGVEISA